MSVSHCRVSSAVWLEGLDTQYRDEVIMAEPGAAPIYHQKLGALADITPSRLSSLIDWDV